MIMGNITRDIECRFTPAGTAVTTFGVAINESYKNKEGETVESVTFVDVDAWGRQAEVIAENLKKGSPIFVEGKLILDTWEKDGEKRTRMKVRCENFQFIGSKPGRE
jgi:single-strand DNA-binding protein